MSTYDTTFVGTTDGLTADNLLKPAKGEIMLLERDSNNFVASSSTISTNSLYDLEGDGTVVANKFSVDVTAPTIVGISVNSNTELFVQFSDTLMVSSITKANAGGFVVKDTTTGLVSYAVSAIAPSGAPSLDEVKLTVATIAAEVGNGGVTVTYVAGGNGTVADTEGNLVATDAVGLSTE